jgi:hypothetical protein
MNNQFEEFLKSEDAIFHYTNTKTALEKILKSKLLKLSSFKNTNDPREFRDWQFNGYIWGEENKDSAFKISGIANEFCNKIMRNEFKIACFSSNKIHLRLENDDPDYQTWNYHYKQKRTYHYGYERSRMWSQYGENHQGVCFVFSINKIKNFFETLKLKMHSDFIHYSKKSISSRATMLPYNRINSDNVEDECRNFIFDKIEDLFFLKDIDYQDEAEYRVVIHHPEEQNFFLKIENCIKGIILGVGFNKVYESIIENYCKIQNIEHRFLYYEHGEYLLLNNKIEI